MAEPVIGVIAGERLMLRRVDVRNSSEVAPIRPTQQQETPDLGAMIASAVRPKDPVSEVGGTGIFTFREFLAFEPDSSQWTSEGPDDKGVVKLTRWVGEVGDGAVARTVMTLDSRRGYLSTGYSVRQKNGVVVSETAITLGRVLTSDGEEAFFPKQIEKIRRDDAGKLLVREVYRVDEVEINGEVDTELFTVKGLDAPEGELVTIHGRGPRATADLGRVIGNEVVPLAVLGKEAAPTGDTASARGRSTSPMTSQNRPTSIVAWLLVISAGLCGLACVVYVVIMGKVWLGLRSEAR